MAESRSDLIKGKHRAAKVNPNITASQKIAYSYSIRKSLIPLDSIRVRPIPSDTDGKHF